MGRPVAIDDNTINSLAEAVYAYLSYVNTVSDFTRLLDESSIKNPFVEYLERKLQVKILELEHNLEDFNSKRADVAFTFQGEKYVFEFKYISADANNNQTKKPNFQLYFNDVMRLAYLHKEYKYHSYFLVCGDRINFQKCFMRDGEPSTKVEKGQHLIKQSTGYPIIDPSGRFVDSLFEFSVAKNDGIKNFDADKVVDTKVIGNNSNCYSVFKSKYQSDQDKHESKNSNSDIREQTDTIFPPTYPIGTRLVTIKYFDKFNDRDDIKGGQAIAIWEVVSGQFPNKRIVANQDELYDNIQVNSD